MGEAEQIDKRKIDMQNCVKGGREGGREARTAQGRLNTTLFTNK